MALWVKPFTGNSIYATMTASAQEANFVSLRQRAGLTQSQLATLIGVTDHTIRNWEKGRTIPVLTPSQTLVVCQVLKCSLEELAYSFSEASNTQNA